MDRRSFIGSILALAAAPAIVRASSLMGFKEAPRPIVLPQEGIILATQMPTPDQARKFWPGADLPFDDAYWPDTPNGKVLCLRKDGILVMADRQAIEWSQGGPQPLTMCKPEFKPLDYRYPPPKRRTPRVVEAQSRFNFVLGTFR